MPFFVALGAPSVFCFFGVGCSLGLDSDSSAAGFSASGSGSFVVSSWSRFSPVCGSASFVLESSSLSSALASDSAVSSLAPASSLASVLPSFASALSFISVPALAVGSSDLASGFVESWPLVSPTPLAVSGYPPLALPSHLIVNYYFTRKLFAYLGQLAHPGQLVQLVRRVRWGSRFLQQP